MAATPDTPSHLLGLPPELRNRIYDLVFYVPAGQEVDIINAVAQSAPPCSLTAVCRQTRSECLSMYRVALDSFWAENIFQIIAGPALLDPAGRSDLMQKCNYFPDLGIQKLRFVLKGAYGWAFYQAVISDEPGGKRSVAWTMTNSKMNGVPRGCTAAFNVMGAKRGISYSFGRFGGGKGGLSVGGCAVTFCALMEVEEVQKFLRTG